ncbi:MAG: uroporphyrinogen decarboxylase family protein [Armatimonadota bacterium]|nr:uroporphyrinogen decarboxylase family protein [Armatimonadota bacterium]MDW8025192.1 uroporphyrinogen decarboxylase family protein [Armatimonadota bacterium]
MEPKELFVAAFYGEAKGRTPVYEQAFASDVASKILGYEAATGGAMLRYQEAVAGISGERAHKEFIEKVKHDIIKLHKLLGFGAISKPWLYGRPTKQVSEFEFLYGDPDGYWFICRYDPVAKTYAPIAYSDPPIWRDEGQIKEAVDVMWRAVERWNEGSKEAFENEVAEWKLAGGDEFELIWNAAGLSVPLNERWLTACALVPELVGEYLKAQAELGCLQLESLAKLGVRIVWGGGDLADNHGPVYGPKFFRRYVLPCYKRISEHAHKLGLKYLFRSDGNLWSITDDLFIEASIDGYGEIDYDAGMKIPELQERYPKLTCWGNISCRLLRLGTPSQVKDVALQIIEQCRERGRLILGSSNAVLPGTPPENYLALIEAANTVSHSK